ncbi:MAG: transporter, partial [Polyangiaceae bacterium]
MPRIALLIPNADQQDDILVWRGIHETYQKLFAARGIELVPIPWKDGASATNVDAVLPLLAWGYHTDVVTWRSMLATLSAKLPIFNNAAVLLWNTRKSYLETLRAAGVDVVPTIFADRVTPDVLRAAFDRFRVNDLVVKPAVSGGGYRTYRVTPNDTAPDLDDAMVQPFLPAIVEEGELSLIFIGGELSHAVRKVPARGDFRVQLAYGGTYTAFEPSNEAIETSRRALRAAPGDVVYARVDLVRLPDGKLAVM